MKKNKPLLTAIVPNYNHAHSIEKSIDCLNNQFYKPDEIIIIDDCSTDNSLDVIETLCSKYKNIVVFKCKKNGGVNSALNRGLALAKGQFIYCGSADDFVRPALFKELLFCGLDNENCGFITSEAEIQNSNGNRVGIRPTVLLAKKNKFINRNEIRKFLEKSDNLFLSVATIYNTDHLRGLGGFDENLGPFSDSFVLRQLALRYGVIFVPRVLGVWVYDEQSYSQKVIGRSEELSKLIEACYQKALNDPYFSYEYSNLLRKRLIFFSCRRGINLSSINSSQLMFLYGIQHRFIKFFLFADKLPLFMKKFLFLMFLLVYQRPISLAPVARTSLYRYFRRA